MTNVNQTFGLNLGASVAHLCLANVAGDITLHAAPLDGARAVPQRQIPATLAVQRYRLAALCNSSNIRRFTGSRGLAQATSAINAIRPPYSHWTLSTSIDICLRQTLCSISLHLVARASIFKSCQALQLFVNTQGSAHQEVLRG